MFSGATEEEGRKKSIDKRNKRDPITPTKTPLLMCTQMYLLE